MEHTEVLYCITNGLRIYTIYKFFRIFFTEFRFGRFVELLAYLLFFITNSFFYLIARVPLITMITNIGSMVIISSLYKESVQKRILAPVMGLIINFCVELFVATLLEPQWLQFMKQNDFTSGLVYIMVNLIFYFVVIIMDKSIHIRQGEKVPYLFWTQMIMLIVMSSTLLISLYIAQMSRLLIIGCTGAIFGVNIIAFMLYDWMLAYTNRQVDAARIMEQNRSYEKQLDVLTVHMEQIRTLRHDLKNHIGALHGMLNSGNVADALQYMKQFTDTLNTSDMYVQTGNSNLDAIINYKCAQAEQDGIKLELDIDISTKVKIEPKDFMTVFGNLMDNAMEALSSTENDKYIHVTMREEDNKLFIGVENPYYHELVQKNNVLQTTKKDKMWHGIGMGAVRQTVEQYNGLMSVKHDKNVFKTNIMMKLV
ncbi:MAG: GHKL domain-containing protein [Eubacteriales bacterium]|nr:GHKL domain-containing protein [Eubacteriales bacterium]